MTKQHNFLLHIIQQCYNHNTLSKLKHKANNTKHDYNDT